MSSSASPKPNPCGPGSRRPRDPRHAEPSEPRLRAGVLVDAQELRADPLQRVTRPGAVDARVADGGPHGAVAQQLAYATDQLGGAVGADQIAGHAVDDRVEVGV